MRKKSTNWDRNHILALLGVILAILGLAITITLPEIRDFLGLEEKAALAPKQPVMPAPKPEIEQKSKIAIPTDSAQYTIHENHPKLVEQAQTTLSIAFHDVLGEKVASLTIAPPGKASSTHAVLNGYTQEFTVSTGTFLVQILSVDYQGKNIKIQITRTSSDNSK
ncbi:MAG: hypothetical protein D3905_12080 [Candidatus Electrothrix sp. AS4_5]|nr:hypothetical protein [Candidatus Electrothrix gigas]